MKSFLCLYVVILFYSGVLSSTGIREDVDRIGIKAFGKVSELKTTCTDKSIQISVATRHPFEGTLYAGVDTYKGGRCKLNGQGFTEHDFTVPVNQCGITVEKEDETAITYGVIVQVQFNPVIQQLTDEILYSECSVPKKQSANKFKLHDNTWMEVNKFSHEFPSQGKPVNGAVMLGQKLLLTVKSPKKLTQKDNGNREIIVDNKVVSSRVHDDTEENGVLVIDETGSLLAQFSHTTWLDPDESIQLSWSAKNSDIVDNAQVDFVTFEIIAPTKGYIGFGFSPNGGMTEADISVVWVDDSGETHIQDMFGIGETEPMLDESQDWGFLYSGFENATHTTVRFARLLDTCDETDRPIVSGAMKLIWSMHSQDPDERGRIPYHQKRGSKSVYLLDDIDGSGAKNAQMALNDTTFVHEFKLNEYIIPEEETTYLCNIFTIPQLTEDLDIVGYEPIVHRGNEDHVHHFLVYLCDQDTEAPKQADWKCYSTSGGSNRTGLSEKCKLNIWAWGFGGGPTYFPHNTGMRWTPKDSGRLVMIEFHFDNPRMVSGKRDSSGVRVLMTNKLREKAAGTFYVTNGFGVDLMVPGGMENFATITACHEECTRNYLPAEGVTVFAAFLHSHTLGRSLALRQFRKGQELEPILVDTSYDFNYQEWRRAETKIMPGDQLILDCNYSSIDVAETTVGGFGTTDEMCMAFVYVYPAPMLESCGSLLPVKKLANTVGVDYTELKWEQLEGTDEEKYEQYVDQAIKLHKDVKAIDWKAKFNEKIRLQELFTSGEANWYCASIPQADGKKETKGGERFNLDGYAAYKKPAECTRRV